MEDFLMLSGDAYNWVKALHVIAVISWMAGLLYLPRLFVYHTQSQVGSTQSETFKIMERRLLRAIMTPAAVVSWVLGLWMFYSLDAWDEPWVHAKLTMVILLSVSHFFMMKWRVWFAVDANEKPEVFYRVANEVPTLLMIGIVIFVIVKPF
ncbi:protoporphyrinogen oxidase HemJ [Magnetovibrio sp. PR-2]|uniref:protoporphyrinogen oxidase HemJ n=1 Tax=Magnetovibrio sp. PR-2 TaxID=3120356 RepID=UPI002FCE537E